MKFRSRDGKMKRVTIASGRVAIIGAEWREIPQDMEDEAYRMGCVSNQPLADVPDTAPQPDTVVDRVKAVIVKMIEAGDKTHFTTDGRPNRSIVNRLYGGKVPADAYDQAWRELQTEAGGGS